MVEVERGGEVRPNIFPSRQLSRRWQLQPTTRFISDRYIQTTTIYYYLPFAQFYSSVCAPVCVCVCLCHLFSLSIEIRKKTRFQFIFPHSSELTRRRKFRVLVFLLLAPVSVVCFPAWRTGQGKKEIFILHMDRIWIDKRNWYVVVV